MATVDTDALNNISIDFSTVKSFEPVETGIYDAVFDGGKVRDNKAGDGKVFNAQFIIENSDDENDGRKLFRGYSLKEQALWALKEMLLACGADEEDLAQSANLGTLIQDAVGAHVIISVEKKMGERDGKPTGKYFNNIESVKPNN
jgi:hypothetical protein